jgi:hypothetical protein
MATPICDPITRKKSVILHLFRYTEKLIIPDTFSISSPASSIASGCHGKRKIFDDVAPKIDDFSRSVCAEENAKNKKIKEKVTKLGWKTGTKREVH